MSHFATPFIVVNLGCEMIYVVEQRLIAQNIAVDKAERVLTDIITVLLHPKLLDELLIPQPVAPHTVVKQLLGDISATSIMKLDEYSMQKLWDLMTMLLKWQISVATNQNIFDVTRRHIRSVAKVVPQYFSKNIFENALKQFEVLSQKITDEDYKSLYNTITLWFSEYQTKISVLMRLGLQKKDGTFNLPAAINQNLLMNLGDNIYKYDLKKDLVECHYTDTNEIGCILSTFDQGTHGKGIVELQLPINFGCQTQSSSKKIVKINTALQFETITTKLRHNNADLTFIPKIPKSPQEDLLEMLDATSLLDN